MNQPAATAEKQKKQKSSAPKTFTYKQTVISCACGAEYLSGSTLESVRVDICANCHPFFTGENKIIDTEGRIEKFKKRYNMK